jgi:hypothetical protein
MSDRVGVRLVLLWAVVTACGFAILLRYKNTPTPNDGLPPERWPAETRLAPASDRATLVLFAHPHCACTHASVSELARLTARVSDRLAVRIVIVSPPGVDGGWDDTELARRAGLVAGAIVTRDQGGMEAARFNAAVSGLTVLYDAGGRLRFAGGITSARGHEGDSFGLQRVRAVLAGEAPDRADAPVFGCSFGGPHQATATTDHNEEGT